MDATELRDMDPATIRAIDYELALIRTCQGWKRDARKLIRVTPEAIIEFDQQMDRWIAGARARIARLRAASPKDN